MTEAIDFGALIGQMDEPLEVLPAGSYNCVVKKAETAKSGTGKPGVKVTWQVEDGPQGGRTFMDRMYISAESPVALRIFFQQMQTLGLTQQYFASKPTLEAVAQALVGRRARIVTKDDRIYNGQAQVDVASINTAVGTGAPGPGAPGPVANGAAPTPPAPAPVPTPTPVAPAPTPQAQAPAPPAAPVAPEQPAAPPAPPTEAPAQPAPEQSAPVETPAAPAPAPAPAPEQPAAPVQPEAPAAPAPAPVAEQPAAPAAPAAPPQQSTNQQVPPTVPF